MKLGQRAAEWCRLREGRVVELAAASMGGLDIFENRLQDPERLELYSRVIKAAGRSTFEAKLRALAKVLADGVMDGGSVYEAMVLVHASHVHRAVVRGGTGIGARAGAERGATAAWTSARATTLDPERPPGRRRAERPSP